jgi:hypothetical protein
LGKKLQWRVLLILIVLAGAIAGFVLVGYSRARRDMAGAGTPTLKDALKSAIKLGLDLRRGISPLSSRSTRPTPSRPSATTPPRC